MSITSTLEHQIMARARFRFFDRDVIIQSDTSSAIYLFLQLYGRFEVDGLASFSSSAAEFTVLTGKDNSWGRPVLIMEGEVWQLDGARPLEGFIYGNILNAIITQVRTHFLIHAGVVATPGHGIILAGDSGHGKTTLVLELVRRGLMFLSDELAAIGRRDQKVHPFPRSLRIRPGTLALSYPSRTVPEAPVWLGKLIMDIGQLREARIGSAVPIRKVIVLHEASETAEEKSSRPSDHRVLGILVNRLEDGLLAELGQIDGVSEVSVDEEQGIPSIRLWASHRMEALLQVEAICRRRRILILDVVKREQTAASFAGPVLLEPISKSEATLELLRRFQGGHKSSMLQDVFGGSSARLFMELGAALKQSDCFRLTLGPLSQMADRICSLVELK